MRKFNAKRRLADTSAPNDRALAVKDVKNCSIGAVHLTILNRPRILSFMRMRTTLALLLPRPQRAFSLRVNNILRPLVEVCRRLRRESCHEFWSEISCSSYAYRFYSTVPTCRRLGSLGSADHAFRWRCNHCTISLAEWLSEKALDYGVSLLTGSRIR